MNFLNMLASLQALNGTIDFTKFTVNYDALWKALSVTGYGMLGVFVITVVIIAVVTILNKITNK